MISPLPFPFFLKELYQVLKKKKKANTQKGRKMENTKELHPLFSKCAIMDFPLLLLNWQEEIGHQPIEKCHALQ